MTQSTLGLRDVKALPRAQDAMQIKSCTNRGFIKEPSTLEYTFHFLVFLVISCSSYLLRTYDLLKTPGFAVTLQHCRVDDELENAILTGGIRRTCQVGGISFSICVHRRHILALSSSQVLYFTPLGRENLYDQLLQRNALLAQGIGMQQHIEL